MDEPEDPPRGDISIHDALRELPLFDDLFLGMQAMNVDLVDGILEEWESQLLREYVARERTPSHSAHVVSAMSQMWVFAAYELLRTWRQRVREIVKWSESLLALDDAGRDAALAAKRAEVAGRAAEVLDADVRWQVFERAANEPGFVDELRLGFDRTEIAFRNIEAVRMTLAKHEVPKQDGVFAGAPGYGRIDGENGSISWQIELGDNEITIQSRRDLADGLRALTDYDDRILPTAVQDRMVGMPHDAYGVSRVVLVLDDGTEVHGAWVTWATVVGRIEGGVGLPFEISRVVDVRHDPPPHEGPGDEDVNAPF
jgi:hypothetical protein